MNIYYLKMLKVLIAEYDSVFSRKLIEECNSHPNFNVIAHALDGIETLKIIHNRKPDVAIINLNLAEIDGLKIAEELKNSYSDTGLILLTDNFNEDIFIKAMELGYKGYILVSEMIDCIYDAVVSVAKSEKYISPKMTDLLIKTAVGDYITSDVWNSYSNLNNTELRIIKLISDLLPDEKIADELFLSSSELLTHRYSIARKLNLKNHKEILNYVLNHNEIVD